MYAIQPLLESPQGEENSLQKTDPSTRPPWLTQDHKLTPLPSKDYASLARCEWAGEAEEGNSKIQDPTKPKIPELIRSSETSRGSALKGDLPSCWSGLSPVKDSEPRPGGCPVTPVFQASLSPSGPGKEKTIPWLHWSGPQNENHLRWGEDRCLEAYGTT